MTAPVFVDTNVFVYRFDSSERTKQLGAKAWLDHLWRRRLGRISTQVQHELYATLSRKLGMPRADARRIVAALDAWNPVPVGRDIVRGAWSLEDERSLSWWDALIVAAAQGVGAGTLLTEGLQAGESFGGVRVVSPFERSPELGVDETPAPSYG